MYSGFDKEVEMLHNTKLAGLSRAACLGCMCNSCRIERNSNAERVLFRAREVVNEYMDQIFPEG